VLWLQLPLLEGFLHGFGTRATAQGDLHRLLRRRPLELEQVHGAEVLLAKREEPLPEPPYLCDASVTDREDLALVVRTADCFPVLLADRRRGVIAAVHAGWQGLLKGVLRRAVEEMEGTFGCRRGEMVVGIGPGIRACCYRVDEGVGEAFAESFGEEVIELKGGGLFLDLPRAIHLELGRLGIRKEGVAEVPLCTSCHPLLFHSFRRDGTELRQMNFIAKGEEG